MRDPKNTADMASVVNDHTVHIQLPDSIIPSDDSPFKVLDLGSGPVNSHVTSTVLGESGFHIPIDFFNSNLVDRGEGIQADAISVPIGNGLVDVVVTSELTTDNPYFQFHDGKSESLAGEISRVLTLGGLHYAYNEADLVRAPGMVSLYETGKVEYIPGRTTHHIGLSLFKKLADPIPLPTGKNVQPYLDSLNRFYPVEIVLGAVGFEGLAPYATQSLFQSHVRDYSGLFHYELDEQFFEGLKECLDAGEWKPMICPDFREPKRSGVYQHGSSHLISQALLDDIISRRTRRTVDGGQDARNNPVEALSSVSEKVTFDPFEKGVETDASDKLLNQWWFPDQYEQLSKDIMGERHWPLGEILRFYGNIGIEFTTEDLQPIIRARQLGRYSPEVFKNKYLLEYVVSCEASPEEIKTMILALINSDGNHSYIFCKTFSNRLEQLSLNGIELDISDITELIGFEFGWRAMDADLIPPDISKEEFMILATSEEGWRLMTGKRTTLPVDQDQRKFAVAYVAANPNGFRQFGPKRS